MRIVHRAAGLQAILAEYRARGHTVAFVPTMGALHEGHLSLLRLGRRLCEVLVISIFVNPLQFGQGEDFGSYPRDEGRDFALAEAEGADVAFVPDVDEMYPEGAGTLVHVGRLAETVEGEARPGHFVGVATVVAKLFNLVRPDVAVFGQKDAQQLAVIKKMTCDLWFDIEIVAGETVREPDGLAMSSRNAYLSSQERARATVLYRALEKGRTSLVRRHDPRGAEKEMWEVLLSEEGVEPGYAVAVDPDSWGPPIQGKPVLIAVAARIGKARLIDNLLVEA